MKALTAPAHRLGILGGGQLGRMSALAAARLGIECVALTPETDAPIAPVCTETIVADYQDATALARLAERVDVVSYEFENIPVATVRQLGQQVPVYPSEHLLSVSQDRLIEKQFLNDAGIATTAWAPATTQAVVTVKLTQWGHRWGIVKTARLGYDGKGQYRIGPGDEIAAIQACHPEMPLILEAPVDFKAEISVIIARDVFGTMVTYGPMLNEHRDHILARTLAPAPIPADQAARAIEMTEALARSVDLIGVLALEMFVTRRGEILANEIAPRTHNSGHWSIDACAVSQFENHIRAVTGRPVAPPTQVCPAEMINLIGDDVGAAGRYLAEPGACVHLYGKREARAGRKMGHVTVLRP